ncbi:MAG: hypothetical protein KAT15_03355, partial [Bacteroidales bacterium]|nr:hypothetical protein [Bacteroidales bacterium]
SRIHISYDIVDSDPGDKYNVWIEVADADGKLLKSRALTGDIGAHIEGGGDKHILWDPVVDGIKLEIGIYVQVLAALEEPPPVVTKTIGNRETEETFGSANSAGSVNTAVIVAQSLVLPGLGLSRATGKPHWLRGVAGYGCLASSVVFNRMASQSYEDYQNESDMTARDDLFNTSVFQDNVSEALAYAAAGIWVTDVIWNIIGASNLGGQRMSQERGFSVKPQFETVTLAPVLALSYRF